MAKKKTTPAKAAPAKKSNPLTAAMEKQKEKAKESAKNEDKPEKPVKSSKKPKAISFSEAISGAVKAKENFKKRMRKVNGV